MRKHLDMNRSNPPSILLLSHYATLRPLVPPDLPEFHSLADRLHLRFHQTTYKAKSRNDILTLVQEGAKVFPQVSSEPPSTLVDVLQPDHADKTVVLYRGDAAEEKWKFR